MHIPVEYGLDSPMYMQALKGSQTSRLTRLAPLAPSTLNLASVGHSVAVAGFPNLLFFFTWKGWRLIGPTLFEGCVPGRQTGFG